MDTRRIVEMLGSFVLGGAVVAIGYELVSAGSPTSSQVDGVEEGIAAAGAATAASGVGGDRGSPLPEGDGDGDLQLSDAPYGRDEAGVYTSFPGFFQPELPFDAAAEAKYQKHGLVTVGAVILRERPDLESRRMGLLRIGTKVRIDAERTFGGGCKSGWHAVFPQGWVCIGAGLEVGEEELDDGLLAVRPPIVDERLPYDYWRVNHDATPFFHRLPSYEEQERADLAGRAWLEHNGRDPMPTHPQKRPSEVPAVVKEYLNAAYYVTIAGEHVKSKRHFMRTNRGVYARKYQVGKKEGSKFQGLILESADELPVHWVVRELPLMKRESEGSGILNKTEDVLPRRSRHRFERKLRIGDYDYYEDKDGLLMRAYAVGKSELLKRPPGISADERWIHVDLSEQTLVAYAGNRPVFTTLVSTGKEKGMTPVGVHRIQSKFIATSMRDQPIEEEAYSIEDVPWTQYFSQNVALHGAFWHGGFGLVRSHGCVNLSPSDARWLFGFTGPALPHGWHAAMPDAGSNGPGTAIVVTE
jgi:hypothetical protein